MTSCQSQYDRIDVLALAAASAFSDTALKLRPGGSISAFCEPPTDTSMPQASCSYSCEPRPEIVSTINSAGCFTRSMALRTSSGWVTQPVDVSLCTTITALMRCWRSAARAPPPPVPGHEIDVQLEFLGNAEPQHRELPGLGHQHLVARRQRIDDRGFPPTRPGGRDEGGGSFG